MGRGADCRPVGVRVRQRLTAYRRCYARLLRRAIGGGAGAATFGRGGATFAAASAFCSAFLRML